MTIIHGFTAVEDRREKLSSKGCHKMSIRFEYTLKSLNRENVIISRQENKLTNKASLCYGLDERCPREVGEF